MLKHIPNALTLTRLVLAPVIAWLMWVGLTPVDDNGSLDSYLKQLDEAAGFMTLALILFVIAALTDLFDGMAARAFDAHSRLGRLIDPIADKAIVGLPLLVISIRAFVADNPYSWLVIGPSAVIIIRDVAMTIIRLTSPDGEGARVSSLAKWKTALELVVVGGMLVFGTIATHMAVGYAAQLPNAPLFMPGLAGLGYAWIGLVALLVITAALSAYTGWQYLRPTKKS